MGRTNVIPFPTERARPRRPVQRYVVRCKRCRVPQAAPGFCGSCISVIDAEGDALRYERLREEVSRMCCGCFWPIQPRQRVAVCLGTGDVFHEACAPDEQAAQAGGESA